MRTYFFLFFLIHVNFSQAQLFNFSNIFRPNIRFSGSFASQINDSLRNFQNSELGAQLTFPLPTKVKFKLSLKNFDIGARQSFISFGYKLKKQNILLPNLPEYNKTGYLTDFSYLRIKIGIRNGVQVMGLSASLSNEFSAVSKPNLSAWFLTLKIKNLKFQYGYGAAIAWSQFIPLAVPIFMTRIKIAKKFYWYNILPVLTFFTWAPSKSINLDFYTGLQSHAEGWKADTVLQKIHTKNWYFSRTQVSSGIFIQFKLGKNFDWAWDAGYAWLNRFSLQFTRKPVYYSEFWPAQWYVKTGLVLHVGKSLFQSKVLGDL